MIWVVDTVLDEIDGEVLGHPPERGGALMGPPRQPVVTEFVLDEEGVTSGASYQASDALRACIKRAETDRGLQHKGILHSHPGTIAQPSTTDIETFADSLTINPHLPSYLVPIAVQDTISASAPHQVAISNGTVAFFEVTRSRGEGIRVGSAQVRVLPLGRDLRTTTAQLGLEMTRLEVMPAEHGEGLVAVATLSDGSELLLAASIGYPLVAPVVLHTDGSGHTRQLHGTWRLETREDDRLPKMVISALKPQSTQGREDSTSAVSKWLPADTSRRGTKAEQMIGGLLDRFVGPAGRVFQKLTALSGLTRASTIQRGLRARTEGLLPAGIADVQVLVVGLGSVGSYLGEHIVRAGVERVVLVDGDTVDAANLSRSSYLATDLGVAKVDAASRQFRQINPSAGIQTVRSRLEEIPQEAAHAMVEEADLVIAATDDPRTQRLVDQLARTHQIPVVLVGLYERADGGEVILSVAGESPCYRCATSLRHVASGDGGSMPADYAIGRLQGVTALGADIHHVASAAVKIGLSLLARRLEEGELAGFVDELLDRGSTYLTLSTVADYWFYPQVFADIPGQHAYQSVWLTPESDPTCPTCGDTEYRVRPDEIMMTRLDPVEVRSQLTEK